MKKTVVALTLAAAAAAGLVVPLLPPPSAVQAEPVEITPVVCKLGDLPPCFGTPPPVVLATPTAAHVVYLADLRK